MHTPDARHHRDCLANFFTNKPSAVCSTEVCDSVPDELLVQMSLDFACTWSCTVYRVSWVALSFMTFSHHNCTIICMVKGTCCCFSQGGKVCSRCIKTDGVDKTKIHEAVSTCIDMFESDKHPVNRLAGIFSGRIFDDAAVNIHNPEKIGAMYDRKSGHKSPQKK